MSIQQNKFKTIADTIRACLGTEDSISPDSFAEKVGAVNETAYEKGYEKGLEEADGVKMACGYANGAGESEDNTVFTVSGLGFEPKDIRIFSPHDLTVTHQVRALVWKESAGGICWMTNPNLVSCMRGTLQDSDVITTNNGFSTTCTASPYSLPVFSGAYYWFAFTEEQEGGYV